MPCSIFKLGERVAGERVELLPRDLDDRTHIRVVRAVSKIPMQSQHAFGRNGFPEKKKTCGLFRNPPLRVDLYAI